MSVWPWKYFSEAEVACHCGCGGLPTSRLLSCLSVIREDLKVPLIVTSAYRCPKYNAVVSQTGKDGPHTTGMAVDIAISGEKAFMLLNTALNYGVTGLGVKQHGPNRFIHLDWCEGPLRPRIWSY